MIFRCERCGWDNIIEPARCDAIIAPSVFGRLPIRCDRPAEYDVGNAYVGQAKACGIHAKLFAARCASMGRRVDGGKL